MKLEIRLTAGVAPEMVAQLRSQLAYCDPRIEQISLDRVGEAIIEVELEEPGAAEVVSGKVRKVAERIAVGGPVPPQRILHRLKGKRSQWVRDLDRELFERGWLQELAGGVFSMQGELAALVQILDEDFRKLSRNLGAREARYPALLGADFLRRIRYFQSFPQHTTFAGHLRPDVDAIDNFMKRAQDAGAVAPTDAEAHPSDMILSPTVCYHAYDALSGTSVPTEGVILTATAPCYRWEARNLDGLRRLWEFHMRELIIVGPKDLVLQVREAALDATLNYCEALGLEGWVENASDLFFSEDAKSKTAYQRGMGMKWELRLPYNDERDSLACASFNNMQRTFGDSCGITLPDQSSAFSGCIGWGLERWSYAVIAQHGLDIHSWPTSVRQRIELEQST